MQDLTIFMMHHLALCYALAIVLVGLALVEGIRFKRNKQGVIPAEAVVLMNQQHAVVIDIRALSSFQAGHIIHALSMPALAPAECAKMITKHAPKPIILVCETGRDSQTLTMRHSAQQEVHYLSGGMQAWHAAGLPTVHKKD